MSALSYLVRRLLKGLSNILVELEILRIRQELKSLRIINHVQINHVL